MSQQAENEVVLNLLRQAFNLTAKERDTEKIENLLKPCEYLFGQISNLREGISIVGQVPDNNIFQSLVLKSLQENPFYRQVFQFFVQRQSDESNEATLSSPPVHSQLPLLLKELDSTSDLVIELHEHYRSELQNSLPGFLYQHSFIFHGSELQRC